MKISKVMQRESVVVISLMNTERVEPIALDNLITQDDCQKSLI